MSIPADSPRQSPRQAIKQWVENLNAEAEEEEEEEEEEEAEPAPSNPAPARLETIPEEPLQIAGSKRKRSAEDEDPMDGNRPNPSNNEAYPYGKGIPCRYPTRGIPTETTAFRVPRTAFVPFAYVCYGCIEWHREIFYSLGGGRIWMDIVMYCSCCRAERLRGALVPQHLIDEAIKARDAMTFTMIDNCRRAALCMSERYEPEIDDFGMRE